MTVCTSISGIILSRIALYIYLLIYYSPRMRIVKPIGEETRSEAVPRTGDHIFQAMMNRIDKN